MRLLAEQRIPLASDHGFIYGRDFVDLDGHIWGPMWMDPSAIAGGAK
jgi:predicted lactoylglutathione lyase